MTDIIDVGFNVGPRVQGPLIITTTSPLPGATINQPYYQTIGATGGVTPYTWSITSDSPDSGGWLSINSQTGVISGTPTTPELENLIVTLTDRVGNTVSMPFTLLVSGVAVPGQVTGVAATANSSSQITVTWNSTPGAVNYVVERDGVPVGNASNKAVFGVRAYGNVLTSTLDGSTVQLRGANLSGLEGLFSGSSTPINPTNTGSTQTNAVVQDYIAGANLNAYPAIVAMFQSWKMNCIRIPLNEATYLRTYTGQDIMNLGPTVLPDNGNGSANVNMSGNYRSVIKQMVADFNAAGIYVILDLHWTAPGPYLGDTPMQLPDTDHSPAFWTQLANDFGQNPGVIFELFNEPYTGNSTSPGNPGAILLNGAAQPKMSFNSGNSSITYAWTSAGYQSLLNAVRNAGAINLVLIAGAQAATDLSIYQTNGGTGGTTSYFPVDPLGNIGAVWHAYGVTSAASTVENALGTGTINPTTVAANLLAQGIPVFITETGGSAGPGAANPDPTCLYATEWADANNYQGHALAWTFNNWINPPGGNSIDILVSGPDGTPVNGEGTTWYGWTFNHAQTLPAKVNPALVLTYVDKNLSPGTTHTYNVAAVNAQGEGEFSSGASATTNPSTSGTTLASFIATIPNSGKYIIGQHWDQINGSDSTIFDQFLKKNGPVQTIPYNGGQYYPGVSILNAPNGGGTQTNTNLTPGIIGCFIPTKANGQNTTGTAITVSGAMAAINAIQSNGGIVAISWTPPSPVTDTYGGLPQQNGTSEFPAVLTANTTANNNLNSAIDNISTQLKLIPHPHLFRMYQEINLNRGGTFWYGTGGVNSTTHPTNSDAIALWRYTYNRMVNINGVDPTKTLFVWNCSLYNGHDSSGSGFSANDPGSAYYSYRSVDVYGGGSTTAQIAATMSQYGCSYYENFGKPWFIYEAGVVSASDPPTYSGDSAQYGVGLQSYFPHLCGAIFWCETWALSRQNNAGALLAPTYTLDKLPTFM